MARLLRESGGRRQEPGPDFRSFWIGFFALPRRYEPHADWGVLEKQHACRTSCRGLLYRRMSVPFDGVDQRRCTVRSARLHGIGDLERGTEAEGRSSAPHSCRRTSGPSPLDNY